MRSFLNISGDHNYTDSSIFAFFNGVLNFRSRWVLECDDTEDDGILLQLLIIVGVYEELMCGVVDAVVVSKLSAIFLDADGESPESFFSVALNMIEKLLLILFVHLNDLAFCVHDGVGSLKEVVGCSLDEHNVLLGALLLDEDGHALSVSAELEGGESFEVLEEVLVVLFNSLEDGPGPEL